jgi:putative acetyltransferase
MIVQITEVTDAADIDEARRLFADYQRELGVDLCFQDFDGELAGLPGAYAPPRGRLYLARVDGAIVGCVALRPIDDDVCEMKRLYVVPCHRASGTGLRLIHRVIAEALKIGYRRICLDTLPSMVRAQRIYERLGFVDIEPYRPNPIVGARYLGLDL